VAVFKAYPGGEDSFWRDYSKLDSSGKAQPLNWGQILRKAKKFRTDADAEDAQEAKKDPDFNNTYSYRKGAKKYVMKSVADIARKYRKDVLGVPRPWD
jgi:hypothetical protein